MRNKAVPILITKSFFLCSILVFSAVEFVRTSDFKFLVVIESVLALIFVDYISNTIFNRQKQEELLTYNNKIKKWKPNWILSMKYPKLLRQLLM